MLQNGPRPAGDAWRPFARKCPTTSSRRHADPRSPRTCRTTGRCPPSRALSPRTLTTEGRRTVTGDQESAPANPSGSGFEREHLGYGERRAPHRGSGPECEDPGAIQDQPAVLVEPGPPCEVVVPLRGVLGVLTSVILEDQLRRLPTEVESIAAATVLGEESIVHRRLGKAGQNDEQPEPGLHRRLRPTRTYRRASRAGRAPRPCHRSTYDDSFWRVVAPACSRLSPRMTRSSRSMPQARSTKVCSGVLIGRPPSVVVAWSALRDER